MAIRIRPNNENKIFGFQYTEIKNWNLPSCDVYQLHNGQSLFVIHNEYVFSKQAIRQFNQDLDTYKKLGSPYIRVPKIIEKDSQIGLLYENFTGVPLLEYYSCASYTYSDLSTHLQDLMNVLDALHQHGIFHLLHPSQLFIQEDTFVFTPSLYLLFGNKKNIFCPPETLKSIPETKQSDIYSFGLVTYRVLCGSLPWGNDVSLHDIAKMKFGLYGSFTLREKGTHIEDGIMTIIEKMVDKSVENRWKSISQIQNALLGKQETYTFTYRENRMVGWNPNREGTYQQLEELSAKGFEVRWFDGASWQLF